MKSTACLVLTLLVCLNEASATVCRPQYASTESDTGCSLPNVLLTKSLNYGLWWPDGYNDALENVNGYGDVTFQTSAVLQVRPK